MLAKQSPEPFKNMPPNPNRSPGSKKSIICLNPFGRSLNEYPQPALRARTRNCLFASSIISIRGAYCSRAVSNPFIARASDGDGVKYRPIFSSRASSSPTILLPMSSPRSHLLTTVLAYSVIIAPPKYMLIQLDIFSGETLDQPSRPAILRSTRQLIRVRSHITAPFPNMWRSDRPSTPAAAHRHRSVVGGAYPIIWFRIPRYSNHCTMRFASYLILFTSDLI